MGGRENAASRRSRAAEIVAELRRAYADAGCALRHTSALELLVATILSAQCTDERVNQVTPALFRRYRTAADYAHAEPVRLEEMIRSTGFYRNKARSIIGMGRALAERFGGQVPDRLEDLVDLPGVGSKTANVVLGTWFRRPAVFVDTHVARLAGRLELSRHPEPEKIERDLMALLPRDDWTFTCHALIWHGRRVCKARKPDCRQCILRQHCPWPAAAAGAPR